MKVCIHFILFLSTVFVSLAHNITESHYKKILSSKGPFLFPCPSIMPIAFGRKTELARHTFDLRYREDKTNPLEGTEWYSGAVTKSECPRWPPTHTVQFNTRLHHSLSWKPHYSPTSSQNAQLWTSLWVHGTHVSWESAVQCLHPH